MKMKIGKQYDTFLGIEIDFMIVYFYGLSPLYVKIGLRAR